ncbi:MAG TPA: serine/threonine-protein phosphatase [Chromatiaceae bacterium]|nr:serine/threonine-protein phosphatase [Chromatiaceae bacterium]
MSFSGTEMGRVSLCGARPDNQDRCAIFEASDTCLLVLGDGLGGHPGGEVAAQTLIDVCAQLYKEASKPLKNPNFFLHQCASHAHRAIVEYGLAQTPPISPRTTLVMALLQEGQCYWSHAGDSRFYLLRDEAILIQSVDHVAIHDPQGAGSEFDGASPTAITRCLGGDASSAMPDAGTPTHLEEGDLILLCSDGFWNQLDEKRIVSTLRRDAPLNKSLQTLAEHAAANLPHQSDNVSAVGVRVGEHGYGISKNYADEEIDELLSAINHLNKLINKNL